MYMVTWSWFIIIFLKPSRHHPKLLHIPPVSVFSWTISFYCQVFHTYGTDIYFSYIYLHCPAFCDVQHGINHEVLSCGHRSTLKLVLKQSKAKPGAATDLVELKDDSGPEAGAVLNRCVLAGFVLKSTALGVWWT